MKWCHSMRLQKAWVCQDCSCWPKASLSTLSGLMGQPRRSAQRSASEALPSGSAHINLPWFCPWFTDSPLLILGVWKFTGLSEEVRNDLHSYLWRYPSLHRKSWVFTDHAEHYKQPVQIIFTILKLRWHLPSRNSWLCFQLRENKDHGEAALGGDTRFLDKLQEFFKTHQILLCLRLFFFSWKGSYLDRDSLMYCLGLILTKSKLFKTETVSSNEEGSAYMHQILKKRWHSW